MTPNHYTQMAVKYIGQAEAMMENANRTRAISGDLSDSSYEIAVSTISKQNSLSVQALKRAIGCLEEANKILDPKGEIEVDDGNFT